MRDIAVLAFMLAFIPLALVSTFNAYLLWGWMGFIALNGYMYGQMATIPYVQVFAILTLILLLLKKDPEFTKFQPNPTSVLFILIIFHGLLSATFAYQGLARNWELYTNILKTLLFCLLMPMLIKSRIRIHAMVLIIAMGVAFHGMLDGLKFLASGGGHLARGIQKFGDNNHFAMVMVMVLPLVFYIYQYSLNKLVRYAALGSLVTVILAVIATNSRGCLLSIAVMALWIAFTGRRKLISILTMVLLSVIMIQLAPDRWFERMDTIQEAGQDMSFMGRVTAWKRASAIALENPVLGGGFHAGQAPILFNEFRYKDGLLGAVATPDVGYPAATQSIYFEVLGDLGFVGLILFVVCWINSLMTARQIKIISKAIGPQATWASDLANYLSASLIAYMVGGALLSAAYFELPYVLMMLLAVLKIHVQSVPKNLVVNT